MMSAMRTVKALGIALAAAAALSWGVWMGVQDDACGHTTILGVCA